MARLDGDAVRSTHAGDAPLELYPAAASPALSAGRCRAPHAPQMKVLAIVAVSAAVLGGASTAAALTGQRSRGPKTSVGGSGKTIVVTLTAPGSTGGFTDPGGVPSRARPATSPPAGGAAPAVPAVRTCAGDSTRIPCLPAAAVAPPPPPPPEAGAVIVAASRVTLQRQLPAPRLVVEPGYAVTGLAAYLEIHTPDDLAFTFTGFRNAVFVTCRWTSFDVDWGDGSRRSTSPPSAPPIRAGT